MMYSYFIIQVIYTDLYYKLQDDNYIISYFVLSYKIYQKQNEFSNFIVDCTLTSVFFIIILWNRVFSKLSNRCDSRIIIDIIKTKMQLTKKKKHDEDFKKHYHRKIIYLFSIFSRYIMCS